MTRLLPCLVLVGLAAATTQACRIPNDDHCVHKAVDSDAWCAMTLPERPFCSPCAAEFHGCVTVQPNPEACPDYSPDEQASSEATAAASTE